MTKEKMNRNRINGIYAITPETEDTDRLVAKVAAAIAGGIRLIQYRNKKGSAQLRRYQCEALFECVQAVNATLIINDDWQLAADVRAHGVHLGRDDAAVARARRVLGPGKIIGVSCYNDLVRAREQEQAGADYVAFGSFFPSATKPDAVAAPLDLLSDARSRLKVPVVAIGGIDRYNAPALLEAGADAIAVLSALFSVEDVEQEARAFARLSAQRNLQFQNESENRYVKQ
jgi:thiamine-phosphate pyrophosphorylase